MATKLKPVVGAVVRLKRDFCTRGGKKYRAGLKMTISSTDREFNLFVYVRRDRHWVRMQKKDFNYYAELVSNPPKRGDDEDRADQENPGGDGSDGFEDDA